MNREEKVPREGAVIGPQFRHFCHGYVVTSHKSQGRTHTSIILAAEEVDAKAAYVACVAVSAAVSLFPISRTSSNGCLVREIAQPLWIWLRLSTASNCLCRVYPSPNLAVSGNS
jgi:hypothetical protein